MSGIPSRRAEGLVAIVTGAGRGNGIARACAELLADHGASVMATDIVVDETATPDPERALRFMRHDVTSAGDWAAAVAETRSAFGEPTVLVNAAGVIHWGRPLLEMDPEQFKRTLDVNLVSMLLGIQAVAPSMQRAGGGSIVNFSSTAGLRGYGGIADYVASKFGVRGLTKAAAVELGPDNIRVNSIHPGNVRTAMTEEIPDPVGQPLARRADPVEIANAVLYLASAESAFATGAEFVIDGGHVVGAVA